MAEPALEREALALFERLLDVPEPERDKWISAHTSGRVSLVDRLVAMRRADRLEALRTGAAAEALDEEAQPERIGAYRIVEPIGRGGMGTVYRGERTTGDFAHTAAIKVVRPGLLSEALVERFGRERQTLAGLSHPNIARLYDGGETEAGSPYIVMEYVDGLPLLRWVEAHSPSLVERRRLFAEICGAVAFAHRNLVVHRDLTPANVLVTPEGAVKLIDFGIARPVDIAEASHGAVPGLVSGLSLTPGYAAPERLTSAEVTTSADIYSLGKLLEKLMADKLGDPELKAILARATAKLPQNRFPTVEALAADVKVWGEGMPVSAFGGGRRYVLHKFVKRYRGGVVAAAASLVLLVAALGITLLALGRAEAARRAEVERFEQTRAIAKALLFDTYDEVSKVPGSTRARESSPAPGLIILRRFLPTPPRRSTSEPKRDWVTFASRR